MAQALDAVLNVDMRRMALAILGTNVADRPIMSLRDYGIPLLSIGGLLNIRNQGSKGFRERFQGEEG